MKKIILISFFIILSFAAISIPTNSISGGGWNLGNKNSSSSGESNSTDNFAVRPAEFNVSSYPKVVKAGNEFNLTINALDNNNSNSNDYNETISVTNSSPIIEYNDSKGDVCYTGNLTGNDKNFTNGEVNITLKYSEVGDLNITIKEINGTEFAKVDNDDTNLSQRLIKEKNITISFLPHHFERNITFADSNFTYFDKDLNQTALMDINITAKNEANETTKNYNKLCYAKDIELNISLNELVNGNNEITKLKYYYVDTNNTKYNIQTINKSNPIVIDYNESNFTTENNGSTYMQIYFNFDRNFSNPTSPMEVNISEFNISDTNITDTNQSYVNSEGNATFYYGTVIIPDIEIDGDEKNVTFKAVIYDTDKNDNLKPTNTILNYNWYFNKFHQAKDGNITNSDIVVSSDYNSSNTINGVDVNITSITNGEFNLTIKRTDSSISKVILHYMSPALKWLWYNKFENEYNISNGSTCMQHFCSDVKFNNNSQIIGIGFGSFQGSEINTTKNKTDSHLKIYR